MTHCPNCGTPWQTGASACAHCGWVRPDVWPPPPLGGSVPPPPPAAPRLLTGVAWVDLTLGILATFVSQLAYGLGMIVMPILYFALRPAFPVFARGIGYGLLAIGALILGAIAWCFSSLSGIK